MNFINIGKSQTCNAYQTRKMQKVAYDILPSSKSLKTCKRTYLLLFIAKIQTFKEKLLNKCILKTLQFGVPKLIYNL